MKLLFDQHLSFRLVAALAAEFPESTQVRLVGLDTADDRTIWDYARANGYVIVSKDEDFATRAAVDGFPPKVIRIRTGNGPWRDVEKLLRLHYDAILAFAADPVVACLELW